MNETLGYIQQLLGSKVFKKNGKVQKGKTSVEFGT